MNDKKLGAIIVLVISSVVPAMILGGYVVNALAPPNLGPVMECLALRNQQISEDPVSLNMSLAILNCGGEAIPVNAVKLGQIAESSSPGVAVYVNGTYVDCATMWLFLIQPGDTAVVNMIVPYAGYPYALSTLHSSRVVSITVLTDKVMYYVECNCTGS